MTMHATTRARTADLKRERERDRFSIVGDRGLSMIDTWIILCRMNRGKARRNARDRTRKHSVLALYRFAKYNVA